MDKFCVLTGFLPAWALLLLAVAECGGLLLLLLLLAVVKRGGLEGGVALRRAAGFELFGCGPRPAVGGSSSGWSLFRRASTSQPAS